MDIKERAKQYAEGKALEAITSAIEQAYAKGYETGYADGLNRNEVNNQGIVKIDDIEYVDLNLPSGTLWSKDYINRPDILSPLYLKFHEAAKLNIPTESQFVELERCCTKEVIVNKGIVCGFRYKSKENHAYLDLYYCTEYRDQDPINLGSFGFWLNIVGENIKRARKATIKGVIYKDVDIKLPVRVVIKKTK